MLLGTTAGVAENSDGNTGKAELRGDYGGLRDERTNARRKKTSYPPPSQNNYTKETRDNMRKET